MTSQSLISFLPIICTILATFALVVAASFSASPGAIALMSAFGLLAAILSTFIGIESSLLTVQTPLLLVDPYGLFMMQLILVFGIIVIIFSYEYWQRQQLLATEYYICVLLSLVGAQVMVISDHLASFFLGLELMTIPLYAMISYFKERRQSLDVGVKYLILAGTSTALLLFGIALIYAQTGTMSLVLMNERLALGFSPQPLFLIGFALIIVGVAFKISAVPFHLWTADVYAGAPLPVIAYLATISKGATMAFFLKMWLIVAPSLPEANWVLAIMAALSMIGGNILALKENNLKRLLGYSSVAQFGYILMTILSSGVTASEAFLFYLAAYGVTILMIFGALICIESKRHELVKIEDLHALLSTHKFLSIVLLLGFFSLMGIPFTAIFMGKILIIMAGVESSQWLLIGSLLLSSIIGLFVYLRLANALLQRPKNTLSSVSATTPWATSTLCMLAIVALVLGLWPTLATDLMPTSYEQSFPNE